MIRTPYITYSLLLIWRVAFSPLAFAQNEVPNAGFEAWTGLNPDSWSTFNANGSTANITPSSDAYHELLAVRGEVLVDNMLAAFHTSEPFPISQNYNYLVGYYTFAPQGDGDMLRISVNLWNDDPNNFSLKLGELEIEAPASQWTQFVVPIVGDISGTMLVGSIEVLLVNPNTPQPHEGSYFLIDDLALVMEVPGTEPERPQAPDLSSPSDDSEDISIHPTLAWNAAAGATSYQVQVATSSSFDTLVVDEANIVDTSVTLDCLLYHTTYFWRVRASNAEGASGWSNSSQFTTIASALHLASPLNDATDVSTHPTFEWDALEGATAYHVQVATVADFSTTVVDESGMTAASFQGASLENGTSYYWRVQASSPCGTGDWSDVRHFTTASTSASFHEIRHDIIDGYGWFGGDDRPDQGPRHVGVGQSVLVDEAMTVERFSFYFRGPFDYAANPDGTSHAVTLALNVRDASGAVLKTLYTDLPDTFVEDWVPWYGIDLEVPAHTVLIFTTYLVGGYDVLQVKASQGADVNAGYAGGERFGKHGTSDADMDDWTDWSVHQFWDSAFKLEGTLAMPTHVSDGAGSLPERFVLHQNYPNPFNPATTIAFHLAEPGAVDLTIFNVVGQAVRTLVRGRRSAGVFAITWDGRDGSGQPVASGVYLYRLQVGEAVQTRRMLFVK